MTRYTLIVLVAVLGICQATALAFCPTGYTNEIFCDDFDTYCVEGGHPGETKCPETGSTRSDALLIQTWPRDPLDIDATQMLVQDEAAFPISLPFGGNYPSQISSKMGQMTIRDWVNSPPDIGDPDTIRNISWLIEDTFGSGYTAVVGTDAEPLVLEFAMNGKNSGKIYWDNGYIELALGDDRAPMDYVWSPNCATYCSPAVNQGPFTILCAQGNPEFALPAECPPVSSAPIHAAIAVGVLGILDTDPCHCSGGLAHGPTNYHLNVYDGQKWYMLRSNSPYPSSGEVTPVGGAPMPPPPEIHIPGYFTLYGGANGGKPDNWVTLTIKDTTIKVELKAREKSAAGDYYWVTSVMDNIPREYKYIDEFTSGAFTTIRLGMAMGCELANNTSWTECVAERMPLIAKANNAGSIIFDDLVLYGGAGDTVAGACCNTDSGICTDNVFPEDCLPPLIHAGPNTSCATELCCVDPFADADGDDDVDMADFGLWQACFSGSGYDYIDGCECFDRHPTITGLDGDVDADDFTAFINCWSGPTVPVNPACDD